MHSDALEADVSTNKPNRGEASLMLPATSGVKRLLRSGGPVKDVLDPAQASGKRRRPDEEAQLDSTAPCQDTAETGSIESPVDKCCTSPGSVLADSDRLVCLYISVFLCIMPDNLSAICLCGADTHAAVCASRCVYRTVYSCKLSLHCCQSSTT